MIDLLNRIGFKQVAFGGGGDGGGGGGGGGDGGGGSDSGQANNPPPAPPKPAPTPAPTNQYSSAAYVDSKGREFGSTYSSDPNRKPTQVDKITDVAGYGQGDGNRATINDASYLFLMAMQRRQF
jgi:hypothetical protein